MNSQQGNVSKQTFKYHLCQQKLNIPSEFADEDNYDVSLATEITLCFPDRELVAKNEFTWPVFAFLPVCDLGFKFIINCYWSLVTSRESINEHSKLNNFYREKIGDLFEWLALNDSEIKNDLQLYLPKLSPEMSNWWKLLISDIKYKLKPIMSRIFNSDGGKQLRIYNETLKDLVEDEQVLENSANFKLLHPSKLNMSDNDLIYYDLKKFSIHDLLECLKLKNEAILNWIDRRPKEWWENLFKHLNKSTVEIHELKNANIFFIRKSKLDSGPRTKRTCLDLSSLNFTCSARDFESWHEQLNIVDFESIFEEKFIKEHLNVRELAANNLVGFILKNHIELAVSKDGLWLDLEYIKKNFDTYESYIREKESLARNVLLLPTVDIRKRCSLPVPVPFHFTYLPSIFGYDLTSLADNNEPQKEYIDFDSFKTKNNLSLTEILEWELFFIRLGCALPQINIDCLNARLRTHDSTLSLLKPLSSFDESASKIGLEILKLLNQNLNSMSFIKTIKRLPINAKHKITERMFAISEVGNQDVFKNHLPSICIPEHCKELADNLGISIRSNFLSCLKILKTLVEDACQDEQLYIEWFLNLKMFMNNKDEFDSTSCQLICLYSVDDQNSQPQFYRLDDIYCCVETQSLKLICKYLNKTMINYNHNSKFKPIETVLIELGCKTYPSIEEIIACLCKMANDSSLFNHANKLSFLKAESLESFREMYALLEKYIQEHYPINPKYFGRQSSRDLDLSERIQIGKHVSEVELNCQCEFLRGLNLANRNFPLITCDAHLICTSSLQDNEPIYVCFQVELLYQLKNKFTNNVYFDFNIARSCPFTMGYLRVNYLNDMISICWSHFNNNFETQNNKVNELFRSVLNKNDIYVFKVKYISTKAEYTEDSTEISLDMYNNMKFVVFQNRFVFVRNLLNWDLLNGDVIANLALFKHVLKFLLKYFYPERSDEQIEKEAREAMPNIAQFIKKSFWEHLPVDFNLWPNEASTKFKLSEMLFELVDSDENDLKTEYNFEYELNNEGISYTNPKYIADEEFYTTRLRNSTRVPKNIEQLDFKELGNVIGSSRNQVNIEQLKKKVGVKAEHFVCCYLKSQYGESFNELINWESTARNLVYPSTPPGDDTLGYDFKIKDFKHLFTSDSVRSDKNVKTCYIEVKGCTNEWDGTFHISKNELDKRHRVNRENETYIVAIVEHALDRDKIKLNRFIDLTNEFNLLRLDPDSFLATITLNNDRNNLRGNQNRQYNHSRNNQRFQAGNNGYSNQNYNNNINDDNWRNNMDNY